MCEDTNKLRSLGYLKGTQVFLQKSDIQTNFPEQFRTAHYCMYCGKTKSNHESSVGTEYDSYKTGRINGYFTSDFNNSTYRFNLVTYDEFGAFKGGEINFPEPTHFKYCSTCGQENKPDMYSP